MPDMLQTVGSIAGIGGITVGVLLYIYRDIIRRKIFPTLASAHATVLLTSMVALAFVIAILGIFAGLAAGPGALPFIALVFVVLGFVVVVLLIVTRFFTTRHISGGPRSPEEKIYARVHSLIVARRFDDADRELAQAVGVLKNTGLSWYWRSRVAFARGNFDVAITYINEALKHDERSEYAIALQIKLLLLSTKRGGRAKAKARAEASQGISNALDAWLTCLKDENMFGSGIRSNTELDTKCPFPEPSFGESVR